jgi:polysaccharide biosynthesis/export protein
VRVNKLAVVAFGLGVSLSGPAIAQQRAPSPRPAASPAAPAAAPAAAPPTFAAPATSPGYVIGRGDVLKINVWKEPDLTLEATVRLDGMITVPLVGDVQAAGRVPSQLATALVAGLARFVENPRVTVGVEKAYSARIYVVGEAVRPGEFPLAGGMTVLKALALAGGFKEFAKREDIIIVREDRSVIQFNYRRVAEGKDVAQNVLLAPGDTIIVP